MPSAAETLARLSKDLSTPVDHTHQDLRQEVEARIQELRIMPRSSRIYVRSVSSNRVGPTLSALIELMRGTTEAEKLDQFHRAQEQVRRGAMFEPPLPPVTPVILEIDTGQDTNYDRPMIGHFGASISIDQTESPAAIRGIDVVTKYPIRPGDQIAILIDTHPNKTPNLLKQAEVEARDQGLRSLTAGVGSVLQLKLLDDLSRVGAGIFKPIMEEDHDFVPALDQGDPWISGNGHVAKIILHRRTARRSLPPPPNLPAIP